MLVKVPEYASRLAPDVDLNTLTLREESGIARTLHFPTVNLALSISG